MKAEPVFPKKLFVFLKWCGIMIAGVLLASLFPIAKAPAIAYAVTATLVVVIPFILPVLSIVIGLTLGCGLLWILMSVVRTERFY